MSTLVESYQWLNSILHDIWIVRVHMTEVEWTKWKLVTLLHVNGILIRLACPLINETHKIWILTRIEDKIPTLVQKKFIMLHAHKIRFIGRGRERVRGKVRILHTGQPTMASEWSVKWKTSRHRNPNVYKFDKKDRLSIILYLCNTCKRRKNKKKTNGRLSPKSLISIKMKSGEARARSCNLNNAPKSRKLRNNS